MSLIIVEYLVDDGHGPEPHRWVVPDDVTVGELVELVDNNPNIRPQKLTITSAGEWPPDVARHG